MNTCILLGNLDTATSGYSWILAHGAQTCSRRSNTSRCDGTISDTELEADYVRVAVDILAADRPVGDDPSEVEADIALRQWAVDVLDVNTPVALTNDLKASLRQGDVTLSPIAIGSSQNTTVLLHCSDFATQAEAQEWYDEFYPFSEVVTNLDGDHDGTACEGLG